MEFGSCKKILFCRYENCFAAGENRDTTETTAMYCNGTHMGQMTKNQAKTIHVKMGSPNQGLGSIPESTICCCGPDPTEY